MSKMVQLRHVPDELHKVLKARAALAGKALSDYLIAEMQRHAEYPTVEELRQRLHARTPVRPTLPDAAYLALAESLPASWITCDAGLAAAPGHRASVELVQTNRA